MITNRIGMFIISCFLFVGIAKRALGERDGRMLQKTQLLNFKLIWRRIR